MRTSCLLLLVCVTSTIEGYKYIESGGKCNQHNGDAGICTHINNCTWAMREVQNKGRPVICNFEGLYPIVCCPEHDSGKGESAKLTTNSSTFKPFFMFLPYDKNNFYLKKCLEIYPGPRRYAYLQGTVSQARQYPHMALLGFRGNDKIEWQCGGTLVSNQFVLTAAHCLSSKTFGELRFIRLGDLDITTDTDDADPQDFLVKETFPHPDYRRSSRYHDIALIRLDKPAKITDYVKPACLGITQNLTGTYPVGMGWGSLSPGGQTANILQSGFLSFVSTENCTKTYRTSSDLRQGILEDLMICADGGGSGRDTCQGDSGGPLQVTNYLYDFNDFPEIVGVTSFGKGCGIVPAVYTRVYNYASWIRKIVWPNQ